MFRLVLFLLAMLSSGFSFVFLSSEVSKEACLQLNEITPILGKHLVALSFPKEREGMALWVKEEKGWFRSSYELVYSIWEGESWSEPISVLELPSSECEAEMVIGSLEKGYLCLSMPSEESLKLYQWDQDQWKPLPSSELKGVDMEDISLQIDDSGKGILSVSNHPCIYHLSDQVKTFSCPPHTQKTNLIHSRGISAFVLDRREQAGTIEAFTWEEGEWVSHPLREREDFPLKGQKIFIWDTENIIYVIRFVEETRQVWLRYFFEGKWSNPELILEDQELGYIEANPYGLITGIQCFEGRKNTLFLKALYKGRWQTYAPLTLEEEDHFLTAGINALGEMALLVKSPHSGFFSDPDLDHDLNVYFYHSTWKKLPLANNEEIDEEEAYIFPFDKDAFCLLWREDPDSFFEKNYYCIFSPSQETAFSQVWLSKKERFPAKKGKVMQEFLAMSRKGSWVTLDKSVPPKKEGALKE